MRSGPITDDDWGDLFARMGAPAQQAVQQARKQLPPEPEPPVEPQPPPFEHECEVCNEIAYWGYGVSLRAGQIGNWFCYDHRPDRKESRS